MEIKRDRYLNKLISFMWDGQVKVIIGIRCCGKSFLLQKLFRDYLISTGVASDHIIELSLDLTSDIRYRNPLELAKFVRAKVEGKSEQFYLFVDEIQMSDEVVNPYNPDGRKIIFYDALNDLQTLSNLDIYVTGSNSKMLSSDILTEFRGRSDEIRVHPLSFAEYYSAVDVGVVYSNEKDSKEKTNKVARELIFNLLMRFRPKKRQKPKTSHFRWSEIPSPKSLFATIFASVGMMITEY